MYLSREEEKMLEGEYGLAVQKAISLLVAIGDVNDAPRLIPVTSVHISGTSYKEARDAGVMFLEFMAQNKLRIPATTSSIGLDLNKWEKMEFSEAYAKQQLRMVRAFEKMEAISTHTCTPYLAGHVPTFGSHVAWSPSESIIAANSRFGARTNRESDPSSLMAAMCGRTPLYGFHLTENRAGQVLVVLQAPCNTISDFGALGYLIGREVGDQTPVLINMPEQLTLEQTKMMGAAMGTSGAIALYHIVGHTPEAPTVEAAFQNNKPTEKLEIEPSDIKAICEGLCSATSEKVDLVHTGCPHCSINELKEIAQMLKGQKISDKTRFWITTSSAMKVIADRMGITKIIEQTGAEILEGTCLLTAPGETLEELGLKTIVTNSAKMAHYAPGHCNQEAWFGSITQCVKAAITGKVQWG